MMSTEPRTVSTPHDFAAEAVMLASVALALLLLLPWLGFAVGVPVTRGHFWAAMLGWLTVAGLRVKAGVPGRIAAAALAALALAFSASLGLADAVYDLSYDGSAYHQVGVIALRDGWNPITQPHVVEWSNAAWPERRALAERIADAGLWTDHFPKAAWLLGAQVSAAFGTLDGAKWIRGFMLLVAIVALARGLVACGVHGAVAWVAAGVAVVSPVTVSQLNTNYVDEPLGCALAIQAGAAMAWLADRKRSWLMVMAVMLALAANFKFTGLVYSGLLWLCVLGAAWARQWRPTRTDAGVAMACVVGVLAVTWQTYAHNAMSHGHPFYPVATTNVMQGQATDDFLARGRIEKFLLSATQVPNEGRGAEAPQWPLPRPWHYRTLSQGYDARMAGFGGAFIYSLVLGLAVSVWAVWVLARRQALGGGAAVVAGAMIWALASSLLNPELWWVRYVPQLWWVPVLAAVLAWQAGGRVLAAVTIAPAAAAAALVSLFWLQDTLGVRPGVRRDLEQRARSGQVLVKDSRANGPMLFTFAQHVQALGARLVLQPPDGCVPHRMGMVELCGPSP